MCLVCLFVRWPVSPRIDLNKRQYNLCRPDRWEYPTYFGDIKAGLSCATLEIYSWLIYTPPLLHVFVHFSVLLCNPPVVRTIVNRTGCTTFHFHATCTQTWNANMSVQQQTNMNDIIYHILDTLRFRQTSDLLILAMASNPQHQLVVSPCLLFIPWINKRN